MKTTFENAPKRFKDAVSKLYNAFHNDTLNYNDCKACAVGNIVGCDGWLLSTPTDIFSGSTKISNVSYFRCANNSGYSIEELSVIERVFILAFKESKNPECKDSQFKGLCAVVEYLCELDNIENPMDFTIFFETENNKPKYQLL